MKQLTKKDLETPRSTDLLLSWVMTKIEEFATSDEGKSAIRKREGLCKELIEEVLPVAIFGHYYFKPNCGVLIQPVIGNQNYDAVILRDGEHCTELKYLEVTQAHEGEPEYLRMLALDRDGHVPVLGDVKKSGTKATGIKIEVENVAKGCEEVVASELGRIEVALRRKSDKTYPSDCGLIVVFDDYISMRHGDDKAKLRDLVQRLLPELSVFRLVSAVGWSARTFIACENPTYSIK